MRASAIQLVCFDLGGIIVRHHRSWATACVAAGIDVRAGSDSPDLVQRRRALTRLHGTGQLACDEFFVEMSRAMNGLYTPAEVSTIHHAWLIDEYADVGPIIDDIHAAGVPTSILSNTNPSHWARQFPSATGPAEFPTAQKVKLPHASHVLGFIKPDAEIYRAFEDEVGYRGSSILFFDDLVENVEAARALGWRAELIDYKAQTSPQLRRALIAHGVVSGSAG